MDEQSVLKEVILSSLQENKNKRRWGVFFKSVFWTYLFFVTITVIVGIYAKPSSSVSGTSSPHVALIELNGIISSANPLTNSGAIVSSLEKAFKNENSRAVVLRINSPGGSAVESDITFRSILTLRMRYPDKPIVAVAGEYAASGGYYIAVACEKVYANQNSLVGSIGVRLDSFGFQDAMKHIGVERRLFTAGDRKALLDPFSPLKNQDVSYLKAMLASIHTTFVDAVKEGRGERLTTTESIFDGRAWLGSQALPLGLIDGLSDYRSIVYEFDSEMRVVDYSPQLSLIQKLSSDFGVSLLQSIPSTPSFQLMP